MACTKNHHGGVCTCPPERKQEQDPKKDWPEPAPPDDDYVAKEREQ